MSEGRQSSQAPRRGMHKCPVRSCPTYVENNHLMCLKHWHLVPGPMKAAVINEYRRQPLGPGHVAASDAAIRAVERGLPHAKDAKEGENVP